MEVANEAVEKVHLSRDIIAALSDIEGVRVVGNENPQIKSVDGYLEWSNVIRITLGQRKVYYENHGCAYKIERGLNKIGIHYPRWMRNVLAYRRITEPLTLAHVRHALSIYPTVGLPAESGDSFLAYSKDINGVRRIKEQARIIVSGPS